jgi:hypothetical protein
MYTQRAYSYFQSHKDEIRQKQRTKYDNDFASREKRQEQRNTYMKELN